MGKRRNLQLGTMILVSALLLCLLGGDFWNMVIGTFGRPELASALLYLETGRLIRPAPTVQPTEPLLEPTAPSVQSAEEPLAFSPEDGALVEVYNDCGYETDIEGYLTKPLVWNLSQEEPTVLIFHTHATESYENTENYPQSSPYRTTDVDYNVVSVGEKIAEILEAGGVKVIHDKTLHDQPSYNDAYKNTRQTVEGYLQQYPSIRLVLDIHRDSIENGSGVQVPKLAVVSGEETAQLMMVVGTDAGGQNHPQWSENMALAVKLQAQLEKKYPGICRPICFRSQRYNQDLSPGAMLVEVGSAGNTRQQALRSAQYLAECILDLSGGSLYLA